MLNYGGSITSAFPNSLCTSPNSISCQLCNKTINSMNNENSGLSQSTSTSFVFYKQQQQQQLNVRCRLDKCIHCGLNICDKCLNENQEKNPYNHYKSTEAIDDKFSKTNGNRFAPQFPPHSQSHFCEVKKDFKQMYNYSKEIVEKLHFLNNAIKIEELAISELNSIKHQVTTKAIELVKQVNQEKVELIDQIENAKRQYESTLNERKEYYALSMQYKDELKKVIRKYKDAKIEEQCSLSDLLKMYMSVKTISKNLDDYDHIKLITEEEPLQVDFEERPVYRNIIGKLLLNHQNASDFFASEANKLARLSSSESVSEHYQTRHNTSVLADYSSNLNKSVENLNMLNGPSMRGIYGGGITASHRSASLNDLIDAGADNTDSERQTNPRVDLKTATFRLKSDNSNTSKNKMATLSQIKSKRLNAENNKTVFGSTAMSTADGAQLMSKSINNLMGVNKGTHQSHSHYMQQQQEPFYLPTTIRQQQQQQQALKIDKENSAQSNNCNDISNHTKASPVLDNSINDSTNSTSQQRPDSPHKIPFSSASKTSFNTSKPPTQPPVKKSILKKPQQAAAVADASALSVSDLIYKRMERYRDKLKPRERMEIDIMPSFVSCSNNKLLVASASGKIRVVDLVTYKIQKDELKSLMINGICKPKNPESGVFYAVTNGDMKQREDELNVSNSTIIVTKSELKVLKKNDSSDNDNYLFSNPKGICYDDADNLYICDCGYNRVKVLDRDFQMVQIIDCASGQDDPLSQPASVTSHKGLLYVCDAGNQRIVVYTILNNGSDFKFKGAFGLGTGNDPNMYKYPMDMVVDSQGLLCVHEHHFNRVHVFGPDLVLFHTFDTNPVNHEHVYSMAVADAGDVYVAKMTLNQYDHSGQFNKYFIDIY